MSEAVIRLENIVKNYGKHAVLNGVSMQVNEGDIYGLVGKNGAGKTTIFKIILGLSEYTSGSLSITGSSGKGELNKHRRNIGFFVGSNFFGYLSARENLEYYAGAKGIPARERKEEIDRVLSIVELTEAKGAYKGFSLGMRQRLGIANAILGNPKILILDEPTNGLDPQGIADVRNMIHRFNEEFGMTVIVSSHILGELENTADRFGIVNGGIVAGEITQKDLEKSSAKVDIEIAADDVSRARELLEAGGVTVLGESKEKSTLEDFYFKMIGGDAE